jgi:hypothetical protein
MNSAQRQSGDTPDFSTDRSTYLRHHEEVRKLLDEKSYMGGLNRSAQQLWI